MLQTWKVACLCLCKTDVLCMLIRLLSLPDVWSVYGSLHHGVYVS